MATELQLGQHWTSWSDPEASSDIATRLTSHPDSMARPRPVLLNFAILRLKVVARSSAFMMHPYRGTKLSYTTTTSPICRFRSDGAKIPGDAGGRESAWDASPARATEGPAAGRRRGSPIGRKGNREYALRCTHCENTHATYYITAGRGAFLVAGKSPLRAMRHGGFCGRGMEIGANDPRNPACCGGIPNCRPPCPPGALR